MAVITKTSGVSLDFTIPIPFSWIYSVATVNLSSPKISRLDYMTPLKPQPAYALIYIVITIKHAIYKLAYHIHV